MRSLVFVLFSFSTLLVFAQKRTSPVYIHSHNDYLQQNPLFDALNAQANSIEIDVFLQNGDLLVAHTKAEIIPEKTLENLYILPLQKYLETHTPAHDFHFMIDIKSEPVSTLNEIQQTLGKYPELFSNKGVRVIISGNRPNPKTYADYADFIWFDGRSPRDARGVGKERIAMISQNLSKFTSWRGEGEILPDDSVKLEHFIAECHRQDKPVRLWNTGDSEAMYHFLYHMGVDYINTDSPGIVRDYLIKNKLTTNK